MEALYIEDESIENNIRDKAALEWSSHRASCIEEQHQV